MTYARILLDCYFDKDARKMTTVHIQIQNPFFFDSFFFLFSISFLYYYYYYIYYVYVYYTELYGASRPPPIGEHPKTQRTGTKRQHQQGFSFCRRQGQLQKQSIIYSNTVYTRPITLNSSHIYTIHIHIACHLYNVYYRLMYYYYLLRQLFHIKAIIFALFFYITNFSRWKSTSGFDNDE